MVEMKTITYNGVTYEIVDEKARTDISELNEEIVDLKEQGMQLEILYAQGETVEEALAWLEENGNTNKMYILPNGNIARYTTIENGSSIEEVTERVTGEFLDNTRLSTSSGTTRDATGFVTTPFVNISNLVSGAKIKLTGARWAYNYNGDYDGYAFTLWKDGSFAYANYLKNLTVSNYNLTIDVIDINTTEQSSIVEFKPTDGTKFKNFTDIRFSGYGTSSNAIVELIYEKEVQGTVTKWIDTGQGLIPSSYDERLTELEATTESIKEDVEELKTSGGSQTVESVPSYVVSEAEEVAQKVLSVRSADSFVMALASDFHTNGNDTSATGVKHTGQGMEEINSITQLDLVALLGDYEVYDLDDGNDDGEDSKQSFKCVRKAFNEVSKNVPIMWLQGNHDRLDSLTQAEARQQYYAFIGANNVGMVTDYANKFRNYGYRDFENYKVRVIYLNSVDVSDESVTTSCHMSAEQLQWLVDVALQNLEENWGVIVLTHHPLNWEGLMVNLQNILNAFKGKASGSVTVSGTTISYNFSNVKAEFIAHFHGHLHNFRTSVYGSNGVISIAIPNACYDRNNEYGTASAYGDSVKQAYGDVDENGSQRQFNKTSNSANDTSFNVVVIDRVTKKIQLYCYGTGIDRELTYGDTETNSTEILSVTWNDNNRLSTSDGGLRTGATGYTASDKIDLSLLSNVGDTLTVTGLSFDGTTYVSRSIAGFKDGAFITSYYPSKTTTYPIGDSGVTLKTTNDTYTTLIFERVAENTDGKSYSIALCGYGSGANAVLTLEHK